VKIGALTVLTKRTSRESEHLPQFETEIWKSSPAHHMALCSNLPLTRPNMQIPEYCLYHTTIVSFQIFPILILPFVLISTLRDI
jgi:hypothetical protein